MTTQEKQKILKKNLKDFQGRLEISKKQRALTITELATEIADCEEGYLTALRDALNGSLSPDEEAMLLSGVCCTDLGDRIRAMLFIGSSEPTQAGAHSKISFVKNKYNDTAFDEFSRTVINAKPDYASSFKESCESVYDGRCEFCILPLTNSSDGRLMSFYALIDRYELKICNYTDIEDDISGNIMLALLSRSCKEPKDKKSADKRYIFEFSTNAESTEFISDLLLAAKTLDAELLSIDSIPLEYSLSAQRFFFTFSAYPRELLALRLFIALKNQSYTPIGLYQNKN